MFHRFIINGPQGTHVARKRVLAYPSLLEPRSVSVYQLTVDVGEEDFLFAIELEKRAEGGVVIAGSAVPVHPAGTHNLLIGKRGKTYGNIPGILTIFLSTVPGLVAPLDIHLKNNTNLQHHLLIYKN